MKPASLQTKSPGALVQVAIDATSMEEGMRLADAAIRAGADWLEAGTPFIHAEGMHGIQALRTRFPDVPIVADLKTMDGGRIESVMAAQAGATHVVVMARSDDATIQAAVAAGQEHGFRVMGDDLGCADRVSAARRLEKLGCDFVIHHVGLDEREAFLARTGRRWSPLDQLREIAAAVSIPVGTVGGLSIDEAAATSEHGASIVILATPLTVAADDFSSVEPDVEAAIRTVCRRVHARGAGATPSRH